MAVHGCTVHRVTPELDDGPILGQGVVPIEAWRHGGDTGRAGARHGTPPLSGGAECGCRGTSRPESLFFHDDAHLADPQSWTEIRGDVCPCRYHLCRAVARHRGRGRLSASAPDRHSRRISSDSTPSGWVCRAAPGTTCRPDEKAALRKTFDALKAEATGRRAGPAANWPGRLTTWGSAPDAGQRPRARKTFGNSSGRSSAIRPGPNPSAQLHVQPGGGFRRVPWG